MSTVCTTEAVPANKIMIETMPQPTLIHVSAVVLRNSHDELLTVRKNGTARFMLPGGKPEPGEDPKETAVRECQEELGAHLVPENLRLLGTFRAPAANERGSEVEATVFTYPGVFDVAPSAEIAELRWMPLDQKLPHDLAPLLEYRVIPLVTQSSQ